MFCHSSFFSKAFNILAKSFGCFIRNRIPHTNKLIPRNPGAFHFKFSYFLWKSLSGCTCYTNIGAILFSLRFQIIWTIFSCFYGHNNNCFSIYCLWFNIRNNLRHTRIGNSIGNSIHYLK